MKGLRNWYLGRPAGVLALGLGLASVSLATLETPSVARPSGTVLPPQPRMGKPLPDLTAEELDRFDAGGVQYRVTFEEVDGLGPVFNRPRCAACHIHPVAGGTGTLKVTRFGSDKSGQFDPLEELGGSLWQMLAINDDCAEEIPVEANVTAERVVNGSFGYGLIEAIPDAALLALEQDPPGVSGRAHMVEALEDPGTPRVGRFGWKAQVATILTFSADASLNEMGLTNRLLENEVDPNGIRPPELADCDTVDDPEDGPDAEGFHFIDRVTDFQRFLAAPPQTPKSGMQGEDLFNQIGCNECHHPAFTTADDPELEDAIRNRSIRPYSDFLLHDMGEAGDGIAQGDAGVTELRTPPLWGVRTRRAMWHDGRFNDPDFDVRVRAAIEAHGAEGSEGVTSVESWQTLTPEEQTAVLRFLDSLGRREFDIDGDEVVVLDDFAFFAACFGPGPYTPDDPCAVSDIDQDGDVDADDFDSFLLAFNGTIDDCNENGTSDLEDILFGESTDTNQNGIPDDCEQCVEDLDEDGVIGFGDLLVVLAEWGTCPGPGQPCPGDLDDSGRVDFGDILAILAEWGPCV